MTSATRNASIATDKVVLLVRLLNAIDESRHSFDGLRHYIAEGEQPPSPRTLRRYLTTLADAGFPWYFDRASNIYRYADGYSLKRMNLDGEALVGLVAMRSFSQRLSGRLRSAVDQLTDKFVGSAVSRIGAEVASASPISMRIPDIVLDPKAEDVFGRLNAARGSSRSVRFTYSDKHGRISARIADPYGFIIHGGRVYCLAHDHDRRQKRIFAIDSITDLTVLATTFLRPVNFNIDEETGESISGLFTDGAPTEVTVRYEPIVARAALAARILAHRRVHSDPDGSITITYRVRNVNELARWVLGWGTEAEIISPESARVVIAQMATGISTRYTTPPEIDRSTAAREAIEQWLLRQAQQILEDPAIIARAREATLRNSIHGMENHIIALRNAIALARDFKAQYEAALPDGELCDREALRLSHEQCLQLKGHDGPCLYHLTGTR